MMMSWIAIAVLAGLASALIFAAAGIPTFAAAAVFLLAPAPLLIAGLGWGLLVTLTAGLAGAVVLAVLIANYVTHEGESTWFEGVQLLAVYVILALAFGFA